MSEPGSMWGLGMEIMTMGDKLPDVRDQLARAQREGGRGMVSLIMSVPEADVPDETADSLGAFYMTLITGLIAQWNFDPASAPDADQLTEGLRQVLEGVRKAP
jgi:hypothetical protein